MAAKVTSYERLLLELLPSQPSDVQQEIRKALTEVAGGEDTDGPGDVPGSGDDEVNDEFSISATACSLHFQDRAQYDSSHLKGSGYLGKASVVRWMEEALDDIISRSHNSGEMVTPYWEAVHEMNGASNFHEFRLSLLGGCAYFADAADIADFSILTDAVDALQLPPRPTADTLVNSFFSAIHPIFPILPEDEFLSQYGTYLQTRQIPNGDYIWLAILNIVFAIGALHEHHKRRLLDHATNDHTVFWIRSQTLVQETSFVVDIPTLEHIQFTTLTGLYLISQYQINRAWHVIGKGIRYAYTRALHLVNVTPDLTVEKELEIKVWHSLCSVEQFLAALTGRPTSLQGRFISARFPRFNESHNSPSRLFVGSFARSGNSDRATKTELDPALASWNVLVAGRHLDAIVSDVLVELYSASTVNCTWAHVQRSVARLDMRLERWKNEVVPGLLLQADPIDARQYPSRERMYLLLRFYATSILINQVSLCEARKLSSAIPSQSEASKRMDNDSAARCVSAARNLIQLLPVNVDAVEFYRTTPWWCALHYLVQAGVVLMAEISYGCSHTPPSQTESLINESYLVLRWLYTLSPTSYPAYRAWLSLSRLLRLVLAKTGRDSANTPLYMANIPVFVHDSVVGPSLFPSSGHEFSTTQNPSIRDTFSF
ncbi:hypothetical protein VTO42DRAFT_1849 [Malbranchea cinnamomea]